MSACCCVLLCRGPGFAASGIWKYCEFRAYNEAFIQDLLFIAQPANDVNNDVNMRDKYQLAPTDWVVNVTVFLRVASQGVVTGVLTVTVAGSQASVNTSVQSYPNIIRDGDALIPVSVVFTVSNPNLWYPLGYGDPSLYGLTVTWSGAHESSAMFRVVGFRKIVIIRESIPPDAPGKSMIFQVNGIPIFVKGSNLVPFDSFHSRVTETNITTLVLAAVQANQNIIRVWGGGLYQDQVLYDFADQHGILIWQEFMFACGMYPTTHSFLVNVREEVTQAVRTLSYHPSIAIFGGNNENEAMLGWQSLTVTYRDRYLVDEFELYIETVRDALVREIGLSIEFQWSSPSNGPLAMERYTLIYGNPYDDTYGDNHWSATPQSILFSYNQ